jgi:hypothetical protein
MMYLLEGKRALVDAGNGVGPDGVGQGTEDGAVFECGLKVA